MSYFRRRLQRYKYPGYDGIDPGDRNRISCTIVDDEDWSVHKRIVMEYVDVHSDVIAWLAKKSVAVCIDIAIMPEERGVWSWYRFSPDVLGILHKNNVELMITIYDKLSN